MGVQVFNLTSMVITHFSVGDSVLVQLALTLNPCSNIVDILLRSENIRRSLLANIPMPPKI
jgi:hypothetical protein